MVIIENANFVEAVKQNPLSQRKLVVMANSTEATLKKILDGQTDLQLGSIDSLASYLGFDVQVSFIKRSESLELTK